MKQVFYARHGNYVAFAPDYCNPFSSSRWLASGQEALVAVPWHVAGVLRNLVVRRSVAPGAGASQIFTLRVNGADTGLQVTIADTSTSGSDAGPDVAVSPGDLITLRSTPAGGPAASVDDLSIEFEGTTARQSGYAMATSGTITGTKYNSLFRASLNWSSTNSLHKRDVVGVPGILNGIRYHNLTAPGAGKSIVFTVMKNSVAQDGSGGTVDTRATLADTATSVIASFSLPLVAGDEVGVRAVAVSSPSSSEINYGALFTADVDGFSQCCGHVTGTDTGATAFADPTTAIDGALWAWSTTESAVQAMAGLTTFQLIGLIVHLDVAPGAGNSYTFSGRVNSATPGGSQSVVISDSETEDGDAVGLISVAAGDVFALQSVPASGPDIAAISWVFGMFISTINVARVTQLVALLVQNRDPDPAVVPPPTSGGTVGTGTDPAAGIDLCPVEVPVAFMDITPPGLSARRYSAVPINVTVEDDPRVASFGSVTRALVKGGDIRGSSASADLIDTDRFLRGLESTDGLVNSVIEYYISSEAGIKAGSTPRRVFSGIVTDSEPLPELKMRVQATDYLQALLDKVPLPTYPQRVFSVADFPNLANDPKSTTSPGNPSLIGKPIPIGYGLLSDESLGLLARGVVPAFFVGKRLVAGFDWDEYVVFGHAPSPGGVLGFFGDLTGGVARDRFDPTFEGVDFLWPGHAGWTASVGAPLYRDFNGNRYTVVYARGPRSDSAREGRIPFSINIGGVEDVGDGTGLLIESLPLQLCHLLINFVLQNYTSGAWLAPPVVNGYSRVKTSSFVTVKGRSEVRTASGWLGAFLLGWNGGTVSLRDIARLASEHGLHLGTNKDGQIIGSTIDPFAGTVRNVNDITDTIEKSFQARRQRNDIRTYFWKKYARRYVPALPEPTPVSGTSLPNALRESHVEWEFEDTTPLIDTTGDTKYGERKMDLLLELTRDTDTAEDLAEFHREVLAPGPVLSRYREGLCGTNIDLGDNHELTHFEGITSSGWTDQLLRCEQHRLDLDRFEVEINSLDIAGLVGSP